MMNPEADAPGSGDEARGGRGAVRASGRPEVPAPVGSSPWAEKFAEPTLEALLAGLGEVREPAERVRALLLSDAAVTETVSWEGVAWRWSLVYSRPADETRAWAYVIPDPAGPRVCVPLVEGAIGAVRLKRLKKGVREAVLQAQTVAGVRWVTLGIAGAGGPIVAGIEEIQELLRAKREGMEQTGAAPGGSN